MTTPSKDRTNKLLEMMSSWNTKSSSASGSQTPNSSTLRKKKQGQRTLPGSSAAVVVRRDNSVSTSEFEDFEAVEYIKAQSNQPKTPRKDDDRGRSKEREEQPVRRSKSSSASNSAANSAANSRASSPPNAPSTMSETEAAIKRAQAIRGSASKADLADDRSETSSVSSASTGIPRPGGSRLPVFGGSNLPRPGVKRAQSSYALTAQPDAELLLSGPLPNASAAAAVVAASGNNTPASSTLTPASLTNTPSSVASSRAGPSPAPAMPRSLSSSPAPQSLSVATAHNSQATYPSAASPSPISSPSAPSDSATAAALLRIRSSTPSLAFNASTGTYTFASTSNPGSVGGSLASSRSTSGASSPVHGGPAPNLDRRTSRPEVLDSDVRSRGSSDADARQFDELGAIPPAFPDAAQDAMLKQLSERLQNTTRALETQPLAELDHSQLMQELLNVSRMLHVRVTAEKLYSRLRRLEYQLQGQEAVHKMTLADMEAEHKSQIKVLTEQWSTKVRANTQKFQEEVHMREMDISQLQTEMHRLRELLKNNGIPF